MDLLQPLNLPPYPFKITEQNGQLFVFDTLRKKTLVLTPEEWVRQHFVQYLINQKKYAKSLIKLEGGLRQNGRSRRSDIVVYNTSGNKILLVECKAPSVPIVQDAFDQAARYNSTHHAPLLAITNGLQHYYCAIDFTTKRFSFLEDLPKFQG